MAPVILQTRLYGYDSAKKIRNAIKNLHGVEGVWVSPETGQVVVAGTADARTLQWRIQQKTGRRVAILSDGTEEYYRPDRHYYGMMHLAPPEARRPHYYGWGPTAARSHYGPLPGAYLYPYGDDDYPEPRPYQHYAAAAGYRYPYGDGYGYGYYPAPPGRRYLANGEPTVFTDEYEDDACCPIQ